MSDTARPERGRWAGIPRNRPIDKIIDAIAVCADTAKQAAAVGTGWSPEGVAALAMAARDLAEAHDKLVARRRSRSSE